MYDPKTGKFELIYTCFGTHHLQFSDKQDMLYFSGGGATIPWVNVKTWEATKNEQQSTGWCPTVIDTNGDGKITKPWNEPVGGGRSQEEGGGGGRVGNFDPKLDTRVNAGSYGIIVSPVDDSVWSAGTSYPGRFIRLELGNNPPETCKAEMYTDPRRQGADPFRPARHRYRSRRRRVGGAVGQRRLRQLRSPEVQGVQRAVDGRGQAVRGGLDVLSVEEGSEHDRAVEHQRRFPLLQLDGSVQRVGFRRQHAGRERQRVGLNARSSTRRPGDWTQLRVPYPLGFYSRGLDGRIDDPATQAGRAAGFGPTTALTSCGTSRVGRARPARWSSSR